MSSSKPQFVDDDLLLLGFQAQSAAPFRKVDEGQATVELRSTKAHAIHLGIVRVDLGEERTRALAKFFGLDSGHDVIARRTSRRPGR